MTKKKNLTAFMIAIMVILFSFPANAQEIVGYAQYDKNSNTLTFYGGEMPTTGAYELYELNTGSNRPAWNSDDASVVASSCTKVKFDASFNDIRPNSCCFWFKGFSKLSTIKDIRYLNTDNVKYMHSMFEGCSGLTSLNLSNFNTANVEHIYQMFNGCKSLTSLDLSSFNTDKVGSMYKMFYGCSGLTSLDLSSFNTAKVTNMEYMFDGCSDLTKIYVSDDFNTDEVSSSTNMFKDCTSLNGKVPYNSNQTDKNMANFDGYFTESNLTPYVKWDANTKVLTFKVANYIEGTQGEWKLNEGDTSPEWLGYDVPYYCTNVVFTPSFKQAQPTSCSHWFFEFSNLSIIEGIEYLNTDNVTNMSLMFGGCSKLKSLDVSNFTTDNVTTMHAMFEGCSGLTTLDVSKFNTAKVTHMTFMFNGCSSLTSLNLSNFNTANVEFMYYMFNGCSSLTSLDLSSFNTDKVGLMYNMFAECSNLTSLDVSNFNTANVTNMDHMFAECSNLTSLDVSNFNTAKVTDMRSMFKDCSKLTTIYVSDDFTTVFTKSAGMFENCTKLKGAESYVSDQVDKSMANYKTGYFKTYYKLGNEEKVELCGDSLQTENSLVLSDDKNFVAHAPFKASSVSYTRNLSSSTSKWYTLCLPFAYTPQNFTAYQLQSATANAVEIKEISTETIAAGTPVLFKFKDDVVDVDKKKIEISATGANIVKAPVVGTAVNGDDGSLQLYGTYQKKTFSLQDNNTFILLNNKLMNPAKMLQKNVTKVGLKPFHAYMTMTSQASAKSFSIGNGDEGTTAIDLLNSVATDDAEYYDINGRRIDAPAKGVNIVRRGNKTIKLIIK